MWVKFVIGFGNELLFYCLSGLCPHPRSLSQVEREERQYKFIVNFIILVIHICSKQLPSPLGRRAGDEGLMDRDEGHMAGDERSPHVESFPFIISHIFPSTFSLSFMISLFVNRITFIPQLSIAS